MIRIRCLFCGRYVTPDRVHDCPFGVTAADLEDESARKGPLCPICCLVAPEGICAHHLEGRD